MSISKSVGRCTLFALVVYLFVKGALIVVPWRMVEMTTSERLSVTQNFR